MKLKKLLIPFLLCSVLCFSFIPKTHAETIQTSNFLMYANTYDLNLNFSTQWEGGTRINTPSTGGFPVFYGFLINNLNVSKSCETEVTYRIDFQVWGWHNSTIPKNWVNLAKSIYLIDPELELIGTIITLSSEYEANFSVFFTWKPTYCPVDSLTGVDIRISDSNVKSPIGLNYFYNFVHSKDSPYYVIYNATYEGINKLSAENLVKEYYENNSITQEKLDNITGQIVDVNNKLDETNEKLEDIYTTITDTSLDTGKLENSAGWLPAGPVDSILNLPLSLYENLLDILQDGQSCPVLQVNLPFVDEVLPIPCLSDIFSRIEGLNVFWTWVGTISGAFLLFYYLINLYKWVDATLTFRENNHFGGY